MGRLSHIDDVERKLNEQQGAGEQAEPVTEQVAAERAAAPRSAASAPRPAQRAPKSLAEQDADFHGLNETGKKSSGHTALIVVAIVIFVVIVAYVCSYNLR